MADAGEVDEVEAEAEAPGADGGPPPGAGAEKPQRAGSSSRRNRERMQPFSASQKARQLLSSCPGPAPRRPLPEALRQQAVLHYDPVRFGFAEVVAKDLLGLFQEGEGALGAEYWMAQLQGYSMTEEDKRHASPGRVHDRVKACESLCSLYEGLLREVVGPHLLGAFGAARGASSGAGAELAAESSDEAPEQPPQPDEHTLLYQFPPTLRIYCSCPNPKAGSETRRGNTQYSESKR
ncbi:unnamed protein product [Prorocentrum cordatum]|uniref:Uncharacterized protein n=1 Tax=Prorocentrum cordatum TaxID=2364126 RepID=A0ABN9WVV4_9DINO|nr:unnamed protein product [Polarella glacialis]